MSLEITITPQIEAKRAALLTKQVEHLDWLLDNPTGAPQPLAQTGLLEQIGGLLWDAAALDADVLLATIERAREDETPVRLTVTSDTWQYLPWELLYHGHSDLGFVGRHPWCVVVRRLHGDGKRRPRLMARPLRLLLFIASPEDLDPERSRLDFEREEELLFTALDGPLARGEVQIDVAVDGRLQTLTERLEQQRYHAVILSMHGALARNGQGTEEWGLLFEDMHTGRAAPVAGSDLAAQLEQMPLGHRPGLVVLSACRSARAEESAASIASVAVELHKRAFERVLGMCLAVLDGAASAFGAELFRLLTLGHVLGRAVTLARGRVAEGGWWRSDRQTSQDGSADDPFGRRQGFESKTHGYLHTRKIEQFARRSFTKLQVSKRPKRKVLSLDLQGVTPEREPEG